MSKGILSSSVNYTEWCFSYVKVAVRAEILPRDFLQTLLNYLLVTYYSQNSKIKTVSLLKNLECQFLKALTMKFSMCNSKIISYLEILIKIHR